MGNNDSFGTGSQNPKPATDKLTYRLFPTSNQHPHPSPKTLQQQTLHRNASFRKRRSVSLDDSSRPHGEARMPFARPSDAPAPRIQDVPANRMKASKADGQDRSCTSSNYGSFAKADSHQVQAPKVLSYKPKVSEDASHGRSSSAPDGMRAEMRTRKPTGLAHMTNAAISSSAKAVRGLGSTWYNPHDSTIGGPSRQDSQRRYNRPDPIQEKPLPPPPPRDQTLDPYHNRSHSTLSHLAREFVLHGGEICLRYWAHPSRHPFFSRSKSQVIFPVELRCPDTTADRVLSYRRRRERIRRIIQSRQIAGRGPLYDHGTFETAAAGRIARNINPTQIGGQPCRQQGTARKPKICAARNVFAASICSCSARRSRPPFFAFSYVVTS